MFKKKPDPHLSLAVGEVHVWRSSLSFPPQDLLWIETIVSADEKIRANRLINPDHRRNFLVAQGLLRDILSRYLTIAPEEVSYIRGSHGKPYLAPNINTLNLEFNMTHSRDLVVFAVTRERELGIDVEYIKKDTKAEQIAKRFFAPIEYQALENLSLQQQIQKFYRGWTRKEAFLKAHGQGLSFPLNRFAVSLQADCQDCLIFVDDETLKSRNWKISSLYENEEYVISFAIEQGYEKIYFFEWQKRNQNFDMGQK